MERAGPAGAPARCAGGTGGHRGAGGLQHLCCSLLSGHGGMLPDQDVPYSAPLILVGRALLVHQPAWAAMSKVKRYKPKSQLAELPHYCH